MFTGFNETVVFAPGETIASVLISIPDDNYSTEEKYNIITVMFTELTMNSYCDIANETTVVIRDDDCK